MNVDSVGLVSKYPAIVIYTIVDLPCVSFLVDFGAEHSRNNVLDDLEYCGRMNDHEVDVHACCGEAASRTVGCRLCEGHLGVEPCGRNTDDSHVVIHLDFAVYVGIAVLCITSDVALEVAVDVRIYEQDSSLIRNFLVIKGSFSRLNEVCDVVAAGKSCGHGSTSVGGIFSKSIIGIR